MKPSLTVFGVLISAVVAGCAVDHHGVVTALPDPFMHAVRPSATRVPTKAIRRRPNPRRFAPNTVSVAWRPPGGIRDRWKYIVIHHSASARGSAALFDRYHRDVRHWDELGYHFVIGNGNGAGDGQVEVGPRWIKQKHGAHCKTSDNFYNRHGIGICLVGDFDGAPPTPAQMASLTQLVKFLLQECRISPADVVTHASVTGHTACPGRRFPLFAWRRSLGHSADLSVMP